MLSKGEAKWINISTIITKNMANCQQKKNLLNLFYLEEHMKNKISFREKDREISISYKTSDGDVYSNLHPIFANIVKNFIKGDKIDGQGSNDGKIKRN